MTSIFWPRIKIAREYDIAINTVDYRVNCFLERGWTELEEIKSDDKKINVAIFERLSERLKNEKGRPKIHYPPPRLPEIIERLYSPLMG